MKTIKEFTNVSILTSDQLKCIKSGSAPDCEGGQILDLYTRECIILDGHPDNCDDGLP